MTPKQFKQSVQKGELSLGFWDSLTHYMICIFILIITISFFATRISDGEQLSFDLETVATLIIPSAISALFYLWQKHKLKFIKINTSLSLEKIKEILELISKEQNWYIDKSTKNIFIARSQPGFNLRSWGEQITVLHEKGIVYVNSICDPEKRSSIISGGMNRKNKKLIIERLLSASNYPIV